MAAVDYGQATVPVRADLVDAHRRAWERLAAPGTSWTGAERVAIAEEVRAAARCGLCARRAAALSPAHVDGTHDGSGTLAEPAVDAIHRVTTDPGRLGRAWFDGLAARGLSAERYVELLGVVVTVVSIDAFCRGIGLPPHGLPSPLPGAPSGHRPAGVVDEGAWVPTLPQRAAVGPEADLYAGMPIAPNVIRALSLVPDEVRQLRALGRAHYLSEREMMDLGAGRALDRAQIELIAGRVSSRRECFY